MTSDTAVEPAPPDVRPGRSELGTISISSRVVQKLAARAAVEVPDAGAAAPRVMGRSVTGARALGGRQTSLTGLPRAEAEVDGSTAALALWVSIRCASVHSGSEHGGPRPRPRPGADSDRPGSHGSVHLGHRPGDRAVPSGAPTAGMVT